jgi:hypothetical protein
MSNHLKFLTKVLISLAFFDAEVSVNKEPAAAAGLERESKAMPPSVILAERTLLGKQLPDFVSASTNKLFSALLIFKDFLKAVLTNC